MVAQLQSSNYLVGPGGVARRAVEAGAGVVAPTMPTPAIDYQNNLNLLLADVRKIVEKDPNLSNEERRTLYQTLGGGTFQTPGSAARTLTNVLNFVENKKLTRIQPAKPAGNFEAGKIYIDATGNRAKYLGAGKWENQ